MLGRIATIAALAAGGVMLSKRMKGRGFMSEMSSVEESVEVDVPVSTAYNQWTQFEEFPRFMSSVQEVRQQDDTHLHWKANVAGKQKEWDAEITHQIPDRRIAWRSTSGAPNAGTVRFEPAGTDRTRIYLRLEYMPEDVVEKAGDAVGAMRLIAKQNLSRFKSMIEERGHETGAWRGTVGAGASRPGMH